MNHRRPEPDSAWARHCPDAFPREWLDGLKSLPEGFLTVATPREADLICGRVTEAVYLGRTPPPSSTPAKAKGKPARNPVVKKLQGWNRFLDGLKDRRPQLTPLAVAIWCWLWKCEAGGLAKTSERQLEKRFGTARKTIRGRLRELERAGFLELRRRGSKGRSSTVYRVRARPADRGRDESSTGAERNPPQGSG